MKNFKRLLNIGVSICKLYGIDITVDIILKKWSESQRYWHTPKHLYEMLDGVESLFTSKLIDKKEFEILTIVAIFHDIVYEPKRKDNEEKSIEFMISCVHEWDKKDDINYISDLIMETKRHNPIDKLSKLFNNLDIKIINAPFIDLLDWEERIYQEYKWAGKENYKKKRLEFLENFALLHTENKDNIKKLIDYINIRI